MARCQRRQFELAAVIEWVGTDNERIGMVADQRREGGFDLVAVARNYDVDLSAVS